MAAWKYCTVTIQTNAGGGETGEECESNVVFRGKRKEVIKYLKRVIREAEEE